MISPTRIAEITALAEAATPGPWQVYSAYHPMLEQKCTVIANVDGEIIDGVTHNSFDFVCTTLNENQDNPTRPAIENAAFIAAARTAIPELLAERDVMVARMAVLEGALEVIARGRPDAIGHARVAIANQPKGEG